MAERTAVARTRIPALDVLRGVAILGTFASNVWLFAYPGGPAAWLLDGPGAAGVVETALRTLANGKFLALLTLLFGIGLELQYRSAVRRWSPWPGRYPVRAAILFAEGLLHYVLVFEFDVLMGYAITSVLVAYLVGRSDRVVRAWMWGVGGVYVAGLLAVTALMLAVPAGPAVPATAAATDSWSAQVLERIVYAPLFRFELVLIVPSGTVLFLVGSRLLRAGAFADSAAGTALRRRLVAVGLGVGVPLNVLTAVGGPDLLFLDRYLVPPVVALGLLGLVTEVVLRSRGGGLRRGVAAVGRTALSCYVLQNLLASALCFGWGLGLAGQLAGPWWVVGMWGGVSAVLLVLAPLWLRRFDRGPLELVAHRLQDAVRPAPRPAAASARPGPPAG